MVCFDLSPAALAAAKEDKHIVPAEQNLDLRSKPSISVVTTVTVTKIGGEGIVCECFKVRAVQASSACTHIAQDNGKLRVRVTHPGYNPCALSI